MKGNLYTLVFAAVLGVVCATMLTAAGQICGPRYAANKEADEKRKIMSVLNISVPEGATSAELLEIFNKQIRTEEYEDMTIHVYISPEEPDKVEAMAVSFEGPGLWAKIKGYLALEADGKTIRGVSFVEHEETPGLGGEIDAEWFQSQFVGKRIVDKAGKPAFRILRPGSQLDENSIAGITGATMTADKVEEMLQAAIERFVKEKVDGR